jgi:hypothetical protein
LYKQELETIVMNCAKLAYFRKNSHRFFWNWTFYIIVKL